MAAASVGTFGTWFLFVLFGGISALPLGGPPLPLDDRLAAIAPDECLWYVSHAGYGPADPDSDHPTEQLYAEPQVERFAEELENQLTRAARLGFGPGRTERVLVAEAPTILNILLRRPSAFCVEDVVAGEQGVQVEAALVVHAGEQIEALQSAVDRLLKLIPSDGPSIVDESLGGVSWKRIFTKPGAPPIRLGAYEGYFAVAVGNKTAETLLERGQGNPPSWLDEIRREHAVEREASIGYINIAGIRERLRSLEGGAYAALVGGFGLDAIEELHSVAGFSDKGCVSQIHLQTDGQRRGLLSLLPYQPLSKRDLEIIPADPLLAVACRLDAGEFWDEVVRLVSKFQPGTEEKVEEALWQIETQIGVNLRDDLLRSLDDVWTAYVPGGDLMSAWLGSGAAVRIKDRARLQEAIEQLVEFARQNAAPQGRGQPAVRSSSLGEYTVYSLEIVGQPMPVAPSWCVGDEWLVFGLMPQTVRDMLDRPGGDSLADNERVADALSAADGPAVLAWQDTPRLFRSVYPWVQMGLQMISSAARNEGIDFDVTALPSAEVIARHLRPSLTTVAHRRDGYLLTSHATLSSGGNFAAVAPVAVGLIVPAVQQARTAARTSQEMNHMKQIALAFHNYADANGRFPKNIYDDEGNALLSWRVQLLPYMEELQMHGQIHLDEPWDSEHNRQFAARVPQVYQSVAEAVPAGKTRMLTLAGEETLWPGDERIGFSDVRDGMSNTLMFVQANPASAVDWMKPDDIKFDPEAPLKGLENERGSFLAAFCDGHVRTLSLAIGEEVMRALATRDGREVINYGALDVAPAPRVIEAPAARVP